MKKSRCILDGITSNLPIMRCIDCVYHCTFHDVVSWYIIEYTYHFSIHLYFLGIQSHPKAVVHTEKIQVTHWIFYVNIYHTSE